MSLLGNYNLSKTENTRPVFVRSNLPRYEVYRKKSGESVDISDMSNRFDYEEDYLDMIFLRDTNVDMRLSTQDPNNSANVVEFLFLDTTGLNNTHDRDNRYATNIIAEMINTRSLI